MAYLSFDDPFHIAFLVFPNITQLDLTGPQEVFTGMRGVETHLYWKTRNPVTSQSGLQLVPTRTFEDSAPIDLLCIPGGVGQIPLMSDDLVLAWIRAVAARARWVTSVCTGSLLLGAAGLLQGYRATTYWAAMEDLALLGAIPVDERVVIDRNRITGGGVTSGIDFALRIIAELWGDERAQLAQLAMEYDPAPPFPRAGSPRTADPALVKRLREAISGTSQKRGAATAAAARRLEPGRRLTM